MWRVSIHQPRRSHCPTVIGESKPPAEPSDDFPTTLQEVLDKMPKTSKWSVQQLNHSNNGRNVAQAIQQDTAVALCDGSLKDGLGTSALIIHGDDLSKAIRAVNLVPGPIKEGDSHQCEMAGIYGVVTLVQAIVQLHRLPTGHVNMACDDKEAVMTFNAEFIPDTKHKNFDLVSSVWSLTKQSKAKWTCDHVKGHQDDNRPLSQLTHKEQLNVHVDRLAKAHRIHALTTCPEDVFRYPATPTSMGKAGRHGKRKPNYPTHPQMFHTIKFKPQKHTSGGHDMNSFRNTRTLSQIGNPHSSL